MNLQEALLDPTHGPQPDLDLMICDDEPIHIPGAIQPHGALLAARTDDWLVTHASRNLAMIIGTPPETALGRPLHETLGRPVCIDLQSQFDAASSHVHCRTMFAGAAFHVHGHRTGRQICIAIEPWPETDGHMPVVTVQSILETFQRATTCAELCELAVLGLKSLSGYDRVMAYRFDDVGDGEVIAEARRHDLEPYLGLRYPASDIPQQARQLYLAQRVGVIVDSHYQSVTILSHPALHDGTPLDMTHCSLRSVSPIHREYMRNMKTAASMTIGLAHHQQLWGMLVCHHGTPRTAGPEIRAAAEIIGRVVSLLLTSLGQAEAYAQRIARANTLRSLIERLTAPGPLVEALVAATPDLLRLVNAEGATLRISGTVVSVGQTPPEPAARDALSILHEAAGGEVLAVADLGLRWPELAACTKDGSGALLLPLSQTSDDAILWFRPELSRDVMWGGNPDKHASRDPVTHRISPRKSFATWKETVRGRSAPWQDTDRALIRDLRVAIDMEAAQRMKEELAQLRNFDYLTGLPNRRLFHDRLQQALARAQRAGVRIGVFYMDLDHFKQINDLLGHPAGDVTLRTVADRLRSCVRSSDTLARLGGDEFAVIQPELLRIEDAASLGQRMIDAIRPPVDLDGQVHHIGLSIGIAVSDIASPNQPDDLMKQADLALYRAKGEGRGQARFFTPDMDAKVQERRAMESDLRDALANDGLELHYQPQVDLLTERILGAEALLRWDRHGHGMVSPEIFVALAEDTGLIVPIGIWVLREACRRACTWPEELGIAVNVSPKQLRRADFCQTVIDIIQETGIAPWRLELEITEGVLMQGTQQNLATLNRLSALGVRFAMDDFGTGYSSLGYLMRFRFDKIKIDRSFVSRLGEDANAEAIVSAVVGMTKGLGIRSNAEGVETHTQAEVLRSLGCAEAQGYLYSKPLSGDAFDLLLRPVRGQSCVAHHHAPVNKPSG